MKPASLTTIGGGSAHELVLRLDGDEALAVWNAINQGSAWAFIKAAQYQQKAYAASRVAIAVAEDTIMTDEDVLRCQSNAKVAAECARHYTAEWHHCQNIIDGLADFIDVIRDHRRLR